MEKFFLTLILLVSITAFGQINIGSIQEVHFKAGEFNQSHLEALQDTKTVFIYREDDDVDLLKSMFEAAWDYTELELVSLQDLTDKNYGNEYSFFTIDLLHKTRTSSSGMVSEYTYIYLNLWMMNNGKKLFFCRIELNPSFRTVLEAQKNLRHQDLALAVLYGKSEIRNWNPLYLKNALSLVNDNLKKAQTRWLFASDNKKPLSQLKNDTLFIPDYTLIKFGKFTGDESKRFEVEKLLKKYPYPYKIVTTKELTERSIDSDSEFYYLSYVKSCTDKFITVVNSKSGEIMYSDYSPISYNIESSDFGKLAKSVK